MSLRDAASAFLGEVDRHLGTPPSTPVPRSLLDTMQALRRALAAERGEGGERERAIEECAQAVEYLAARTSREDEEQRAWLEAWGRAAETIRHLASPRCACGAGASLAARVIDAARDLLKVSGQSPHIGAARTRLQWELDDLDGLLDPEAAPAPSAPPRADAPADPKGEP